MKFDGIYTPVITPHREDGSIDRDALSAQIEYLIDAGVHGLVVCGSLGESSTLTRDEKLDVLSAALEASGGRVPVLCGVAERATAEACRFAEDAAGRGADGFLVLPPLRLCSCPMIRVVGHSRHHR